MTNSRIIPFSNKFTRSNRLTNRRPIRRRIQFRRHRKLTKTLIHAITRTRRHLISPQERQATQTRLRQVITSRVSINVHKPSTRISRIAKINNRALTLINRNSQLLRPPMRITSSQFRPSSLIRGHRPFTLPNSRMPLTRKIITRRIPNHRNSRLPYNSRTHNTMNSTFSRGININMTLISRITSRINSTLTAPDPSNQARINPPRPRSQPRPILNHRYPLLKNTSRPKLNRIRQQLIRRQRRPTNRHKRQ